MIPQIIYVFLTAINVITAYVKNGTEMEQINPLNSFITIIIYLALFAWGGFFDVVEAPQIIVVILYALALVAVFYNYKMGKYHKINFWTIGIMTVFINSLLYLGGFYTT